MTEEQLQRKRERSRRYRERNPDKTRESQRAWRERNPEYESAWRERHRDKTREQHRAWSAANREEIAARSAVARLTNDGIVARLAVNALLRDATGGRG